MEKPLSLWHCLSLSFKIQTAGAARTRGCLLQGRLDLGKPFSAPIPPLCPPPYSGFGSAPCAQGRPSSVGSPAASCLRAGRSGVGARQKLSPRRLWSLRKELLQGMQRKEMGAGSPGRVLCPSRPPASGDMGQPEGLIQLRVLQGASLHLTGALTWLKQLVCPHSPSSASPFRSPPARRAVSKSSLVQGCGPPTRSPHARKAKGAEKCQQLPASKGKINSEQGQLPAASADVSPGRDAGRGCQRVSGSREGERGPLYS